MSEDVFEKLNAIATPQQLFTLFNVDSEQMREIANHRQWLKSIRHERPNPDVPFKVGVYIRYFNQTKYSNYLSYHKKQFLDTIALCPKWTFVGFYIDDGASPPNMESSPEWSHLLDDCYDGKVDLIITQKTSNVSKRAPELTLCARLLAAHEPPIGIYFISEDIYTLAWYYQDDLRDPYFLPSPTWELLPDSEEESRRYLND